MIFYEFMVEKILPFARISEEELDGADRMETLEQCFCLQPAVSVVIRTVQQQYLERPQLGLKT